MKRLFDGVLSLFLGILCFPLLVLIALLIRFEDGAPALYWSRRVGRRGQIFLMPKFRTMKLGTPQVATHLLQDPASQMTRMGAWLRQTSLDELPQLWSVLRGEMSLVGPRPALFNQYDLIELRTQRGVDQLKPGITGWAQINGRDELSIPAKVDLDAYYLEHRSLGWDLKIIGLTFFKVMARDGVTH